MEVLATDGLSAGTLALLAVLGVALIPHPRLPHYILGYFHSTPTLLGCTHVQSMRLVHLAVAPVVVSVVGELDHYNHRDSHELFRCWDIRHIIYIGGILRSHSQQWTDSQ